MSQMKTHHFLRLILKLVRMVLDVVDCMAPNQASIDSQWYKLKVVAMEVGNEAERRLNEPKVKPDRRQRDDNVLFDFRA